MPNPDDVDDGPGVPLAMSENDHDYNDPDSDSKEEDTVMTSPNQMSDGAPGGEVKKKFDPKDPFRPRRKKARRACYACQRAHLTCGDERPCQRCIKRGLAEACQDGVRKKAKYLHDAPPEALLPVLGPGYNHPGSAPSANGHKAHENHEPTPDGSVPAGGFSSMPVPPPSFPVYNAVPQSVGGMPEGMGFAAGQPAPVSPSFQTSRSGSLGSMGLNNMAEPMGIGPMFDPSNPALFNFDLENLNFGSQYPAMEFGILGHMSSNAEANQPDPNMPGVNFHVFPNNGNNTNGNGQQFGGTPYDGSMGPDYSAAVDPSGQGYGMHGSLGHGLPHAYAVAAHAGSAGLGSPGTDTTASPQPNIFDASPTAGPYSGANPAPPPSTLAHAQPSQKTRSGAKRAGGPQSLINRRQRDSSLIYESVKEPYPYTSGFHNLIAFLQKRFSANHTLRIAKSLASIRPSFISCTKTLNRQDLIFMEKCFQRTLFEYEDFMQHCSAPTIVCRRTGEVAAVNKEFTALTGWTKDVLLGKEPNLNINTGGSGSTGRAGLTTPHLRTATLDGEKKGPQPVLLPELLDDDSVVEFYEDFAQLAFENSRGHVNRKCRLLKYRPRQDIEGTPSTGQSNRGPEGAQPHKDGRSSILSGRVAKIDGEHGIQRIEKDGKMDCTYCWVIKRDVFDIPMLMVMNFLPCYYKSEEPRQLAV